MWSGEPVFWRKYLLLLTQQIYTHGVASILAPVANGKYVSSPKGIENVLKQGLKK